MIFQKFHIQIKMPLAFEQHIKQHPIDLKFCMDYFIGQPNQMKLFPQEYLKVALEKTTLVW